MKKLSIFKPVFFAAFCAFLLTACFSERIVDLGARPVDDVIIVSNDVEVTTNAPDITKDPVKFLGDISVNTEVQEEVSYGFFWYDPNDPQSADKPNRIDVGKTSETIAFSTLVTGLPQEKDLIVCAFIERNNQTEMTIGDEVPFVVPKP